MPNLYDRETKPKSKIEALLEDCFSNLKQISAFTAENVREIVQLSFEQQENRAYFSGLREAYALFFNRLQAKDNGILDRIDRAVGNYYTANNENRLMIESLVKISQEQTQQIALLLKMQEKKNALNEANIALNNGKFSATVASLSDDFLELEGDLESQAAAFDDDYGTDTIGDDLDDDDLN